MEPFSESQPRAVAAASGGNSRPSQLWNGIGAKFSLSNYFTSQKYSLFDNETDEISIGQQQYGSTGSNNLTGTECSCGQSQLVHSADAGHRHSLSCSHHQLTGPPSSNRHRSSLSLMSSHYEPVQPSDRPSSASAKPDPVAVLPVTKTSSRYSKGHREQLLADKSDSYQQTASGTAFGVLAAKTALSPLGKGQHLTAASSGEYCLFSSHSLDNTKTSATSGEIDHSSSSFSPYFSLKSKRPTRNRLKLATVVMGVTSLCLLVAFFVLLKISYNAEASHQATSGLKGGDEGSNFRICQSEACREAGKALFENINFTVDPCQDFFEFSCGNWNAKHPIPDDKSRVGTFNLLDDKLTENMKTLLETPKGSNVSVAKSVDFALDLYKECLDREHIDQLGSEPLKEQLTKLLGTSWPIVNADEFNSREADTSFMNTFLQFYSLGFASVVTFVVQPDANETTTKRIYFDSPSFGMGRKEFTNQSAYATSVGAYRKYMQGVVTLLAGKSANATLLGQRLDEMFTFESKLALASTPPENRRSAEVWYNRMSLGEFKEKTESRFDWTQLLNIYINRMNLSHLNVTDDTLVIVEDVPYYKELVKLLDDTPNYVLFNYMGWMFSNQYSKYMGKELLQLSFEYQKIQSGVKVQQPVWKRCVKQVYSELSWAVSRLYVDRFVAAGTKEKATQLIKDLKDAFAQIVHEDTWLDETTRTRALDKKTGLRENVAYPEWILSDEELDKYYGFNESSFLTVTPGKFFESILDINRFSMIKMYRELPLPVNLTIDWPMPPAMVNAAFAPTQNSITIPAAILHPPFFDPGRPVYMNYAAIGSVIGHEITHGFDDQGSQFDKSGNLVDWWTDETKKRFNEGAQCFVKQYSAIKDQETDKYLNGVNAVGENVADNGGVRQAFRAFRTFAEKNKNMIMLPYVNRNRLTPEQLFFVSYANVWCGSVRPEAKRIAIDYDPHTPVKYRVNVPLSNFDQFAKAFNCPAGSKMAPEQKCILW